ncbi:hypothetical protein BLNAU_375 [Blattamonas nauphoetae]|uniref:Uncharacterized protein n=1 Tax=Blattamonas nauphoetae TaxID=2049346 RepID=A0ABQ9YLN0_9EUKA|nr:hypothetical protein BLNAU_375 [Blattamonas nauphoetae]
MPLQQVEILLTRPSQSPSRLILSSIRASTTQHSPTGQLINWLHVFSVFKLFFNWAVKPQGYHLPLTTDQASQLDMTQSEFESELLTVQSNLSSLIAEQTTPKATLALVCIQSLLVNSQSVRDGLMQGDEM